MILFVPTIRARLKPLGSCVSGDANLPYVPSVVPMLLACCLVTSIGNIASAMEPAEATPQAIEFFESKVRPLLVENCQSCHGPKTQWAALRLDSRAAMLQGGDSGPAFTPGDAAASELIRRITSVDESEQMPPPNEGKHLTKQQIETLTAWINDGAVWGIERDSADNPVSDGRDHWAFQPIRMPAVPAIDDLSWPLNEIDHFVLQRLDQTGLTPSAAADRQSLIRRVTFDLIGLPPTMDEVTKFVNDPSPDAYPKLIDRLLASPAYGEQWGRHWLDIARYSDTKGYVYGREERFFVHSAIYRDWVIQALNNDMPYDRFLLLQLAADQAEPNDPSAAAAMGFLTLGRRFLGVQPDIIDDRIDVVTRGTMGLTVGCARCHDHKFDPIPTADYYSLYGVFQNCAEVTIPLSQPAASPDADPSPFEVELQKRKTALADKLAERRTEFGDLARKRVAEYLAAQFELDKYPETSFSQILSKDDLLPTTVRRWQKYLEHAAKRHDPVFAPWSVLVGLPPEDFAAQATQALAAIAPKSIHPKIAATFATAPTSTQEMVDRYAQVLSEVDQQWRAKIAQAAENNLPVPTELADANDEQLRQVLYGDTSPCVIPDLPIVNIEFDVDTGSCVELWGLQSAVDQWILTNPTESPHAVILQDKQAIHNPRIFRRGNPTNLGEEVPLQFLGIVAGEERQPFSHGSGRWELAQAITAKSNPLTARVWVNRVWAYHFGEGLVRTTSDFGTRADPPTHPELLDWLAAQFVESGWSTKSLHRKILLSAAYQQDSLGPADDEQYAKFVTLDPENRLLWRMNPKRLSFEELRDAYLAITGDLDRQMGGKGVDLFTATSAGMRRTVYSVIDRQSLPSVLRVFDFANPDLHTPQRSETTVPQQALFALNHSFIADRARSLATAAVEQQTADDAAAVTYLYQQVLQRDPTPQQLAAALAYIKMSNRTSPSEEEPATNKAWSYGYGEIDANGGQLLGFTPLPYFTGSAWQGSGNWPDPAIGWAQITANGGHPGNDLKHAIVRRWTAPVAGSYAVASTVKHTVEAGDGIRCWILTSQGETLRQEIVHNREQAMDIETLELQAGDTLDFVVDIFEVLNSDQHLWTPKITLLSANDPPAPNHWDGERDFSGPATQKLNPWEQLAQVLLISNELMFVD